MLCRTTTSEPLVWPANSKRKDAGEGYNTLALHLSQLQQLDENPFAFDVSELGSGDGIESTLSNNNMLVGTSHAERKLIALRSNELQRGKEIMEMIPVNSVW